MEAAEKQIRDGMFAVPADDTVMHTRLIDALKTLEKIRRFMEHTMQTGKAAELQLVRKDNRQVI